MHGFVLDLLAVAMVCNAVLVITSRSPIVAVLYLIAVFVLAACYLASLGVVYVGLTYLVVYVGAVAVLFLFVIMMLNVRLSEVVSSGHEYTAGVPLGVMIAAVFMLEALSVAPSMTTWGYSYVLGSLTALHTVMFGVSAAPSAVSDVHLVFADLAPDASFSYLSQVQALGLSLYTYGFLWLLLISFVLLLAMLGPIALCLRSRQHYA
jgi:NADH-ubiquinone oxidoreductase chain 6